MYIKGLLHLTIVFIFLLSANQAYAQHLNKPPKPTRLVDAIKAIKPSLVKIEVARAADAKGKQPYGSTGTGFFVSSEGYVVTNNHVIEYLYSTNGASMTIYLPVPSIRGPVRVMAAFVGFTGRVIDRDVENDLALIKLDQNPFAQKDFGTVSINNKRYGKPVIPQFSTRILEDGEEIAVSGFPLNSRIVTTNVGHISSSDLPGDDYEADIQMNPGNSGGPVYITQTGQILGVAVSVTLAPMVYKEAGVGGTIDDDQLVIKAVTKNNIKDTLTVNLERVQLRYNSGIARIISFKKVLDLMKKNKIEPK